MIKEKKKIKKKIMINGIVKKIDYEVFLLVRDQDNKLKNHEAALVKYAQIYEDKKKHTDNEKILYEYCMQLDNVVDILKYIKENEKENNSKS